MIECHFLPEARQELDEAVAYYEAEREGLGVEFALEVWRTIERIQEFPATWHEADPQMPDQSFPLRPCLPSGR